MSWKTKHKNLSENLDMKLVHYDGIVNSKPSLKSALKNKRMIDVALLF